MKNKFFRTFAVTLAAVLCLTAFSTTAFAGGADPDPAPLPEETGTPTTGGIELDTEDAEGGNNTSSTTEETENTEDKESTGTAETMTDEEMADLLSSLLGSQVDVTVTDEGIQLTNKDDGTPNQTGTVVKMCIRDSSVSGQISRPPYSTHTGREYLNFGILPL